MISVEQFARIEPYFPRQRGNVKLDNYRFINAVLYVVENGCKWRGLPSEYGKWFTVYQRFNRWVVNGVMARVFSAMQHEQIISVRVGVVAVDSTSVKVHPDGHGALKRTVLKPSGSPVAGGTPSFTWYPQMTRQSLRSISPVETNTMARKARSVSPVSQTTSPASRS